MAQKARKDLAKSNTTSLHNLHLTALLINSLYLLSSLFLLRRSLTTWFILSLPAFICQFILERTGRPTVDANTGAVKSAGEDLSAPGLTEYMWDVVWVTWGVDVLVLVAGNWAWWVWAVVPVYGVYKGWGMLGAARQMAGLGGMAGAGGGQGVPAAGNRKQRRAAGGQ